MYSMNTSIAILIYLIARNDMIYIYIYQKLDVPVLVLVL